MERLFAVLAFCKFNLKTQFGYLNISNVEKKTQMPEKGDFFKMYIK